MVIHGLRNEKYETYDRFVDFKDLLDGAYVNNIADNSE